MADRRMFSKNIIDSDAFLDMTLQAQALYFHLCIHADDDGFINNPKKIIRMIGADQDDIQSLIANQFLIVFDSGISAIKHWRIHNHIRKDRYKKTSYSEEFKKLDVDDNGAYRLTTIGIPSDNQVTTTGIQMVNTGKVRLGKDSIEIQPKGCLSGKPDHKKPEHSQYDEIVSYLNEKTKSNFKAKCKKTRDLIRARFAEGHDVKAFKRAIDNQVGLWWHDFKMRPYLRPETLFGSKMDGYANANVTPEQIAVAQGKVGAPIARGMEQGNFNIEDML